MMPNGTSLKVLIVEDDAIIGALLSEMLGDMGHSVCGIETTETGAVVAARQHRPDLMIVDALLRIGTGMAAMRQILVDGPQAVLLIGGSRMQKLDANSICLLKPFSERQLIQAIAKVFVAPVR